MTVPPLNQGVLNTGVNVVAFESRYRNLEGVHNLQYRNGHKATDVKPDRDIHVPFTTLHNGSEHVNPENDSNQYDRDVNRPLQLRIFVRTGEAQRQGDGCCQNDNLPSPEMDLAQCVTEHAGFQHALHGVINPHENGISDESKDDGIGMHRPNPS